MSDVQLPDEVQESPAKETYPHTRGQANFLHRVLIIIGITALVFVLLWILWKGFDVFLLLFGGLLFAVFLRAFTEIVKRTTHLPDKVSLGIVIVLLLILVTISGWWIGPQVAGQTEQLSQSLSSGSGRVREMLSQSSWGQQLLAGLPPMQELLSQFSTTGGTGIFSNITGIVSRTLEVISSFLIIVFVGIFFAFEPGLYMRGLVELFPHNKRQRVWEILRAEEHALRWWLIGTLISMVFIGILSGTILWFLGVPLVFTLALFTALLEFVPYIGPLLATVPPVLLAFTVSPQTALWVLVAYLVIQVLESNVIMPIILKKSVQLPPVITLASQVLLGILAGPLGILFATPLATAVMRLVQMVYVEDLLGDPVDVKKTVN